MLRVAEMAAPEPGPGEARVRLGFSSVNPGVTKKRDDRLGCGTTRSNGIPSAGDPTMKQNARTFRLIGLSSSWS